MSERMTKPGKKESGSQTPSLSHHVRVHRQSRRSGESPAPVMRLPALRTDGPAVADSQPVFASTPASVQQFALEGIQTPANPLPHAEQIQRSFGRHDLSRIQAHQGAEAAAAAGALGARAYATGNHVVFGGEPDLRTATHEAAHVIQQRAGVHLAGGVGREGDPYERHADAVAVRVVDGRSAEDLLDRFHPGPVTSQAHTPAVQMVKITTKYDPKFPTHKKAKSVETTNYSGPELLQILGHRNNAQMLETDLTNLIGEIKRHYGTAKLWQTVLLTHSDLVYKALGMLGSDLAPMVKEASLALAHENLTALKSEEEKGPKTIKGSPQTLRQIARCTGVLDKRQDKEPSKKDEEAVRGLIDLADLREKVSASTSNAQARLERLKLLRRYYQTALDFWTTIPMGRTQNEEKEPIQVLKSDFLLRLGELNEILGIQEGDLNLVEWNKPDDGEESDHTDEKGDGEMVPYLINQIRTMADEIVKQIKEESLTYPEEFEQNLSPQYRKKILETREAVQKSLAPAAKDVATLVPGAVIRYRGSLTDAIKNFTKSESVGKVTKSGTDELELDPENRNDALEKMELDQEGLGKRAIPINLQAFDVDAYIEIPTDKWEEWTKAKLVPDPKDSPIKGKILLEAWASHLEKSRAEQAPGLLSTVKKLIAIQAKGRSALGQIQGYKRKSETEADFELVAQPVSKAQNEKGYGKPYPLGQISKGGAPYLELKAKVAMLREEGIKALAIWLEERHIEIKAE